jgi:hypothetical protein
MLRGAENSLIILKQWWNANLIRFNNTQGWRVEVLCARAENMDGGCQAHRSTEQSAVQHQTVPARTHTDADFSAIKPVKVKSSLYAPWRQSARANVQFHTFQTSVLVGEEWQVSSSGCCTPEKRTTDTTEQKLRGINLAAVAAAVVLGAIVLI